ncbi:MAG: hypothetical protein AAF996_01580 [Pseudomonadota bacterium]
MRLPLSLLAIFCITACSDQVRGPITFSCVSSGEESANPGQEVLFHYAEGYLFLQNAEGGADNVCHQRGTVDCSVSMTRDALTLRQTVEEPYCGYRSVVKTNLDIKRASGAFRLVQEGCDPQEDLVITGRCQSVIVD